MEPKKIIKDTIDRLIQVGWRTSFQCPYYLNFYDIKPFRNKNKKYYYANSYFTKGPNNFAFTIKEFIEMSDEMKTKILRK